MDPTQCGVDCSVDRLPLHRDARLTSTTDPEVRRLLARLGVRLGSVVRAVQRTSGGGRVLASGDLRIAIDRATAHRIQVCLEPSGDPA